MPRLSKLKPEDIVDTLHITEVSEETGEVVAYSKAIYSDEGQSKINSNKKIIKSKNELQSYLKEEYGNFFLYFYNKLEEYDIKPQYKLRFLYLASYLDYNNGDLIMRGKNNTKIKLSRQMMKAILCLKDAEFKNTLKILIEIGLLKKNDNYYTLNTECSIKGNAIAKNKDYTRVFIKTIRDLYSKCEPSNHKQLYYIFKILPYINLQFNMACHNTDCEIMKDISPMTLTEVCQYIGLDVTHRTRLWNTLRGFKINDNYVVCKHCIDNGEYITINPRIYYAGTQIENVSYLIGIFDMAIK